MISIKLPVQSSIMTLMTKAVVKASKGLLRDFSELENLQISVKSNKSFVTSADLRADKILKEELLIARPTYSILSEESGEIVGEDPSNKWIIDPLDGTSNYMHGYPHWAISVALERNDEIIAAITYDPVMNEIFWAEKGYGAYVNDKKIRVSGKKNSSDLLVSVNDLYSSTSCYSHFQSTSIRKTGSTTLDMAYLASGRLDALFFFGNTHPSKWDTGAGYLLIKEAGGVVTDKYGNPADNNSDIVIMCNINLISTATKLFSSM